ncbi:hypothetical protein R6Q57_016056 [Mikania cordata]
MPRVNTSYDDLIFKSDSSHEFPNETIQLTIDPTLPNVSDVSEVCAEKVSVTGLAEKEEERSARRSTECSTSSCSSYVVPKTVFVGKFDDIKIIPNDMLKHFKKTFSKSYITKCIPSHLPNQAAMAETTVTKEISSQLNSNCEPFVPSTFVEPVSSSSSFGNSNYDVNPFDPIEFQQKVCCYACGKPGHIARHFLHRPTEFFYRKNQKVTPKMAELRFAPEHNMTAYLGYPPKRHSEFKSLVDGLILSPINYAIMEHPVIVEEFIQSFWSSVTERIDTDGTINIVGIVQGQPITITEQIIRECLQFGDKLEDPVELSKDLVNRTVFQMGYEGVYPPTEKKLLHPYWRYLAHIVTQCLSGRKGGTMC